MLPQHNLPILTLITRKLVFILKAMGSMYSCRTAVPAPHTEVKKGICLPSRLSVHGCSNRFDVFTIKYIWA